MSSDFIYPKIGCVLTCDIYNEPTAYETDKQIAHFCKKYGKIGFSFIIYPLGGMQRYFWHPNRNNAVPSIHLPDLQLDSRCWRKYINCFLSRWIDLDSEDKWLASISMEHFCKEVLYAKYLGITNILFELKHLNSPKLAEIIKKYCALLSFNQIKFWVILSTNLSKLGLSTYEDIWTIWHNFRSQSGNPENLFVGLSFSEDLHGEFNCSSFLNLRKWYAEPLICIIVDYSMFVCDAASNLTLTKKHLELFLNLLLNSKQYLLLSSVTYKLNELEEKLMLQAAKDLLSLNAKIYQKKVCLDPYLDILQIPLQPLSDNLDSMVYQTFECDQVKYKYYEESIKLAFGDLIKQGFKRIVLFILGAGRGPLVTASLNAMKQLENNIQLELKLYAIEKNQNAVLSLEYCNEEWWNNSVTIIQSDMRLLSPLLESNVLERPDIVNIFFLFTFFLMYLLKVVSELLGSFGDNELSPECLDNINCIIKDHTICIPQSYENYIAPIQSLRLYQCVERIKKEYFINEAKMNSSSATDSFYVVCMDKFCYLDEPQCCFKFSHPNKEKKPNSRAAELKFKIPANCEIMGFAGYFEVILYKNYSITTHPLRHTESLYSWFPALFPLRKLAYFKNTGYITLNISRKLDNNRCWYEWHIRFTDDIERLQTFEIQNLQGESQCFNLF